MVTIRAAGQGSHALRRHTDRRTVSVEAVPEANEPLALRVPTHLLRAARQAARLQLQAASA